MINSSSFKTTDFQKMVIKTKCLLNQHGLVEESAEFTESLENSNKTYYSEIIFKCLDQYFLIMVNIIRKCYKKYDMRERLGEYIKIIEDTLTYNEMSNHFECFVSESAKFASVSDYLEISSFYSKILVLFLIGLTGKGLEKRLLYSDAEAFYEQVTHQANSSGVTKVISKYIDIIKVKRNKQ